MRTLKDAILEKLKVDDITFDKFPIDGTLEEIADFLEDNDFIIINNVDGGARNKIFNSAKSKSFIYITDSDIKRIWFADTSKKEIYKDNPIFFINIEKSYRVYYINSQGDFIDIVIDDKKEFLKELNKRFGWK